MKRISQGTLLLAGLLAFSSCGRGSLGFAWPPTAGEEYPDVQLQNLEGEAVNLATYRGKVLLIEPIGMT